MSQRTKTRRATSEEEQLAPEDTYWSTSKRPFEILLFLTPFILMYEIGLVFLLREDRGTITNLAHKWIIVFMGYFNINLLGLSLPALAVIMVLLVWHVLARNPWRARPQVLLFMALESVLLVVPLLVLARMVHQYLPLVGSEGEIIQGLGVTGRIAMSIGAGLYEELVFRMLIVFVLHTLVVDVLRFSNAAGLTVAILVSALLFSFYHPVWDADGSLLMGRAAFYFAAGLWFGLLYVVRGFGIVVAVHAFYDMAILLDGD
ncbi:MAG: CPBP family intramembrane metalloprotease [Phycisphaerales bacterium]|nr:CPBP family intramembrane metalloprotease [Phycisphaerales bacterium]